MKSKSKPPFVNARDLIIILIIAVLAVALLAVQGIFENKKGTTYASICVNGNVVKNIYLENAENSVFCVDSIEDVEFEIKDGKIRIKSNNCSEKICMNTGFISKPGQNIVCLPKKLSIVIKSEKTVEFDAVVG